MKKNNYILGIDQSTQGTKAILMDPDGRIICRADQPHQQIISEQGWVSHDLEEIYSNMLLAVHTVLFRSGIDPDEIAGIGISNQRETTCLFDSAGTPLNHAVVWQCARAKEIAGGLAGHADQIRAHTGLELSPYFPASKMRWLLDHTPGLENHPVQDIHLGTIDTYLIYRLTGGKVFATDYSNASRTQLLNLHHLCWDEEICQLFQIPMSCLPEIRDSDGFFGMTDLEGMLDHPVPIHGAAGDSHCALLAQGCLQPGQMKVTYGTGSSIMMNVGEEFVESRHGLVTSLGWGLSGKVSYVLEGNINYTGAVITWLKDDMGLIDNPGQTEALAFDSNPKDRSVLVPAFSGLSAPYWQNDAKACLCGMTRRTGKKEIVRAALDSIALQIQAVIHALRKDTGMDITTIHADGGATHNAFLMQRQSDFSNVEVAVSTVEELSALGAACLAASALKISSLDHLLSGIKRYAYRPKMNPEERQQRLEDWEQAISMVS